MLGRELLSVLDLLKPDLRSKVEKRQRAMLHGSVHKKEQVPYVPDDILWGS